MVTTGGSGTQALKARYGQHRNVIIEDIIPFRDIMPHAHVYISNGGYGGVLQAVQHGLPMVVAGVHEGKNEINARINYLKYGVNIGTETPTPAQVLAAVNKVAAEPVYIQNVTRLKQEFTQYDPGTLLAEQLQAVLN